MFSTGIRLHTTHTHTPHKDKACSIDTFFSSNPMILKSFSL